ncbi:MAG: aminotransferase class V-fold PLP-dependent enzyme, partial [Cyanobacteria bacterium]|nr:aminotransferase class V-fold PLP-dependent enzyme [Cyanobacteriota bacterium]
KRIGCDVLSCTGRKYLRGPRGTGVLFVRKERLEEFDPVFLDLHAATWVSENSYTIREDARRFENWEQFYAGKLGLIAAIDYALEIGLEAIEERVQMLAEFLRNSLSEIDGLVITDCGRTKCGIVSFYVTGIPSPQIVEQMCEKSINVSYSTVFGTRLDMQSRRLPEIVRASVHYYNTELELENFCREVRELSGSRK